MGDVYLAEHSKLGRMVKDVNRGGVVRVFPD